MKNAADPLRNKVKYKCAECGERAVVVDGKIDRSCKHETSGVLADISATATGESQVAG